MFVEFSSEALLLAVNVLNVIKNMLLVIGLEFGTYVAKWPSTDAYPNAPLLEPDCVPTVESLQNSRAMHMGCCSFNVVHLMCGLSLF